MTRSVLRLRTFVRASLLVLLVLGLIVRPVLTQIGESHASDHALLTDADGHGHDHDDGNQGGKERGTDHTQGAHGLMHQASTGGAFDELNTVLALPSVEDATGLLPPTDVSSVSLQRFATPFRPPIA